MVMRRTLSQRSAAIFTSTIQPEPESREESSEAGRTRRPPEGGLPAGASPAKRRHKDPGLVNSAISHRRGYGIVKVSPGGMVCRWIGQYQSRAVGGIRGKVKGLSGKSRRTLMERLMGLDWETMIGEGKRRSGKARSVFPTLTYPNAYAPDRKVWKRDLQVFIQRLFREYGELLEGLIWKFEFQRRGAPHFHMLVGFNEQIDLNAFRVWVSLAWYEVVGSLDEKHLKAGTNVRGVYGPVDRLMRYLAKYMGKREKATEETGRVWGEWGALPRVVLAWCRMNRRDWNILMRRVRTWGKKSRHLRKLRHRSFHLYGNGGTLPALLRGLEYSRLETIEPSSLQQQADPRE